MTTYYTIVKHLKSKHAQEPIVLDNLSEFYLRQIIADEIPLTLKQQAAPTTGRTHWRSHFAL